MSQTPGWFQRQRTGLWHLRNSGVKGYRDWQKRQEVVTSEKSHELVSSQEPKYGRRPRPMTVDDTQRPVIAGLATMPSRVPLLRDAFHSIYWQVDQVYVYLNGFEEIPAFLEKPNVKIFKSQDFQDYKDVGKFFALTEVVDGILFTVDDDILYPPDYVSRMLTYLASTDFKAVVGVHGFHLPTTPKSFFDRHTFHFLKSLDSLAFASVLGTGTTAFDISQVGIRFEDFTSYGMADIHLAYYLNKNEVPALVVPRRTEWLKPLGGTGGDDGEPSLYEQTQRNAGPHATILRAAAPWGEDYVMSKWHSLSDRTILIKSLGVAMEVIDATRSGETEKALDRIASLDTDNGKAALKWIGIYAAPDTRAEFLEKLLNEPTQSILFRDALNLLWRTDLTAALRNAKRLVDQSPRDYLLMRQYANFCAGYFLESEARAHFLRAVRTSGARNSRSTSSILFDYFKCLVKFRDFERASVVSVSLKATHAHNPWFQSYMVLCALMENNQEEARDWLSLLVTSSDSPRRSSAINLLVRSLAEYPIVLEKIEEPIYAYEILERVQSIPDELVTLLKIATVVGDQESSRKTYRLIESGHPEFLTQHPEVEAYFRSNWCQKPDSVPGSYVGHRYVLSMEAKSVEAAGPMVSVILTAYNSRETIGFAIESILNQTYENIELIVVDDKSSDDTVAVVQEYVRKDSRVSLLLNERNLGPYMSRNIAIERSRGAFVAIQDADDVSVPDRLVVQLRSFSDETQAVLGQHIRIDSAGAIHLENDGSILGHGPVTLLARRETFDEIGMFAPVRTRGDKEFESRVEHYFGSHALLRTDKLLVYALQDEATNSRVEIQGHGKKRELMLFKERYSRQHAAGDFTPSSMPNLRSLKRHDRVKPSG